MFSSIIGLFKNIAKAKYKKEKKETKKKIKQEEIKILKQLKNKLVGLANAKAKEAESVKDSKKKEKKLKAQVFLLNLLQTFIEFLEFTFGSIITIVILLLFCIALVFIIVWIALNGLLHIDMSLGNGSIFNGSKEEECIQGSQALSQNNFELPGQLSGTLTEQQKNIAICFGLYNDILNGKYGDVSNIFYNSDYGSFLKEGDSKIGREGVLALLCGLMASENDFRFPGTSDILKIPCNTKKDGNDDAWLGLEADYGTFIGRYAYTHPPTKNDPYKSNVQLYETDFVSKYTAIYQYDSTKDTSGNNPSKSLNNFVPYGIATQTGVLGLKYREWGTSIQYMEDNTAKVAKEFGITANIDKLTYLCKAFVPAIGYHGHTSDMNDALLRFWCAMWAASSDNDSQRSFLNYELKGGYGEPAYRQAFLGGSSNLTYNLNGSLSSTYGVVLALNGKDITVPMVKYLYDYCVSKGIQSSYQPVLNKMAEYSGKFINTNWHYSLIGYMSASKALQDVGMATPIASGGNIDDCECYENGTSNSSVGVRDFSNVVVGEPQGIYPDDVVQKLKSLTKYQPFYGRFDSLSDPDAKLHWTGKMTREEWRQRTKWKVPYEYQSTADKWQTAYRNPHNKGNACPMYAQAYVYSAMTGRAVNVQEIMAAEWVYFNGGTGSENPGGSYQVRRAEFCKMAKDAGFYVRYMTWSGGKAVDNYVTEGAKAEAPVIYPTGSLKEQIDYVLENNGIVVVHVVKGPFRNSEHHFPIIQKTGENSYLTHDAAHTVGGVWADLNEHSLEEIIGVNGAYLSSSPNNNLMFAWSPNLGSGSSSQGGSDSQDSQTVGNNVGQISNFNNFLFIGDSLTNQMNYNMNLVSEGADVVAEGSITVSGWRTSYFDTLDTLRTDLRPTEGKGYSISRTKDLKSLSGVVIMLGSNSNTSQDTYKTLLTDLLSKVSCNIYVQSVPPCTSTYNAYGTASQFRDNVKKYNEAIKSFCDSTDRLYYIETFENMKTSEGYLDATYAADDIHLKKEGYQKQYQNILNAINTIGGNITGNNSSVECIDGKIVVGSGEFKETPGQFQGPWGDISSYISEIHNTDIETKLTKLLPYVGLAPVNEGNSTYLYETDKWQSLNGKGVVRYNQLSSYPKGELWVAMSYGSNEFRDAACGAYAASCVLSTMHGKYINTVEVAIAVATYEQRHPGSALTLYNLYPITTANGLVTCFVYTDLAKVIEESGLTVSTAGSLSKDKIDQTLDANGMVIFVSNNSYGNRYTTGGHYIVIREKTAKGYLIYSSTHWNTTGDNIPNYANTWEELKTLDSGQVIYVTP